MADKYEQRLKELLEGIGDTYTDFVRGILAIGKRVPNAYEKLIEYIEDTPDVNTSLVIEKMDELEGIKKVYTGE